MAHIIESIVTPTPSERRIIEACCKANVCKTPIKIIVHDMLTQGLKEFPPPNDDDELL